MVQQHIGEIAEGLSRTLTRPWDRNLIINYARTRTWSVVAEEVEKYFAYILQKNIAPPHAIDEQQPAEESCSEHTL